MPEKQFLLFLDDVTAARDRADRRRGRGAAAAVRRAQPGADHGRGDGGRLGRYALDKAVGYAKERTVWSVPIGAHQGLAHPLAQVKIELELARLMMQKAATLYDAGDDMGAGEAANMAKYAAAEASVRTVDQAIQALGGSSMTSGVRPGGHARERPDHPDRAGQPGDDPQLRRPVLTRPAEVLLSRPTTTRSRPMSDQLVQYSADRGIARIALDSPRNRNALSAALVEQLTRR